MPNRLLALPDAWWASLAFSKHIHKHMKAGNPVQTQAQCYAALSYLQAIAHADPSAWHILPLLHGSLLLICLVINPSTKASLTGPDAPILVLRLLRLCLCQYLTWPSPH